ncbi:MAG TPA: 5-methyltetrahydropteroyltriglutamate--homocysteine S-methyltransferase, partial [Nakamurella sp.]
MACPAALSFSGRSVFLLLSKAIAGPAGEHDRTFSPLDRLDDILPSYCDLLSLLAAGGASWVRLDEPVLVADRSAVELAAVRSAYDELSAREHRPAILVASYFGRLGAALPVLAGTGIEGLAVDLVAGPVDELAGAPRVREKLLVAGVVDGRNVWRTDPDRALRLLGTALGLAGSVAVSTSCSLQHVPYSLAPEADLDPALRSWLAFAREKVDEVAVLSRAVHDGPGTVGGALDRARVAVAARRTAAALHDRRLRARVAALQDSDFHRGPADVGAAEQAARLPLPDLPTTTIGSFPQTPAIRAARAAVREGRIDDAAYRQRMRAEIAEVIALQEAVGLDVLVHGDPERADMVQYFAEQLGGFASTRGGWVQSYGSRCVRPPVLFGDVSRPAPMTVDWSTYAQSLTPLPVKGMLTGPVTILAWSFDRDDQPLSQTATQVALALRDECVDLQAAGIKIIQVDEPALRELLPLRAGDQADYLRWAVEVFRLATSGVGDATSVHTHLCYSEFGEVIGAIDALDADVTSVEAARSHMEVLDDLDAIGFARGIGPGVYDIHSPRVPSVAEMRGSLAAALRSVLAGRLWVNP